MENPESSGVTTSNQDAPTSWGHPANRVHRFIALILMCFLCFGSYFCYDTPGALADNFKGDSHLNTSQFALLYSIYSWPNVILCFIGGYLVDRCFGVRLGTIIYMTIVFIGAVVFALGVYINAFWLMILGRFIFGIGGESLQVAVNNYVVLWFNGKELNMVFGLQLSFSRFGSTVNFWVMEPIYRWVANYYGGYEKLGVALFIASMTCLGSLICGLILGWMDHRAERILGRQEEAEKDEPFHILDVLHFKPVFWLVSVICVAYYLAIFPFIALGKLFFERKFDYVPQDANTVNSMVYLLSAALSPFFGILIDKTGRNVTWVILSIITTIGSHFLLAFTFINPYVGVISLGISYSLLASGLWPLVAMIVPENQLGTAFGICQAVQNLGLATVIILAGVIVDKYGYLMLEMFFLGCLFISLIAAVLIYILDSTNNGILNLSPSKREALKKCQAVQNLGLATVIILAGVIVDKYGYLMLEMFFLGCLFISLIAAVLIYILDSTNNGILNLSPSKREALKKPAVHTEETANLLEHVDSSDQEHEEPDGGSLTESVARDSAQAHSDRIRSRYISHLLPATNIPDRP